MYEYLVFHLLAIFSVLCVQLTPATDGQPQQPAYCLQSRPTSVEPQQKHISAIGFPQCRT